MVSQRPGETPKRVEIHTAAERTGTEKFFRGECERRLCQWIPDGIPVLVRRLRQKQDGEQLHNRYILTDLGGVTFGTGLDEGDEGETDDITLMDRGQYELRWSQYVPGPLVPIFYRHWRLSMKNITITLPEDVARWLRISFTASEEQNAFYSYRRIL